MELEETSILVVEDEPVVREIISAWLARTGSRVLSAANGAEALEVLAANHANLVVSDVQMPVMDGITLLKRLPEVVKHRPAFLFITGYSTLAPREAYDLGADALLEKPIARDHLLTAVKRSLTQRDVLWQTPVDFAPQVVLRAAFDNLAATLREQRLAFGRGGFCMESSQTLTEGPVRFVIEFTEDQRHLQGYGIVRWVSPLEGQVGIELLHVDDENRPWVVELAQRSGLMAFIPRTVNTDHADGSNI
ncbi:MAG TPA: response regulator [Candidatus Saccharimonadales bacterium]|jgi:CheY-like chemotaxis protein|nr:response regulator [Candidatus Saccharimonadales bacterium]